MNSTPSQLRTRFSAIHKDPRIKALSAFGPGGQIFELVDLVIAEIDRHAARVAELEQLLEATLRDNVQLRAQLAGLGALTVNKR